MGEPLTPETVATIGRSEYRKKVLTAISDVTFPPGTVYQTPEGLRAEDEETRCAWDVQGGIYPIRESVFQASYEDAARAAAPAGEPLTPGANCGLGWCSGHGSVAFHYVSVQLDAARATAPAGDPNMDYERRDAMLDVVRKTYAPAPVPAAGLREAIEAFLSYFDHHYITFDGGDGTSVVTAEHYNALDAAVEELRAALLDSDMPGLDAAEAINALPHWKYAGHAALVDRGEVLAVLARLQETPR